MALSDRSHDTAAAVGSTDNQADQSITARPAPEADARQPKPVKNNDDKRPPALVETDSNNEDDTKDEEETLWTTKATSLGPDGLPSKGAVNHPFDCKRCCFFPKGRCSNGYNCQFCHFDHDKRKRAKKVKKVKPESGADYLTPSSVHSSLISLTTAVPSVVTSAVPTPARSILSTTPMQTPLTTPLGTPMAAAAATVAPIIARGAGASAALLSTTPIVKPGGSHAATPPRTPPALHGLTLSTEPPPPPKKAPHLAVQVSQSLPHQQKKVPNTSYAQGASWWNPGFHPDYWSLYSAQPQQKLGFKFLSTTPPPPPTSPAPQQVGSGSLPDSIACKTAPPSAEKGPIPSTEGLAGDSPRSVILTLTGAWGALTAPKVDDCNDEVPLKPAASVLEPLGRSILLRYRCTTLQNRKPPAFKTLKVDAVQ